ncbi:hypothetical protein R1flu_025361 [Riccia fluitans]|uniref:Uncharacterized protein n=1 Tax=Riccia fluitans TaxID=41844 RepID=A0ABD1XXI9_9MARC
METGRVIARMVRLWRTPGFDPPEIEAYSKRARRHLETLQDITIEEDNIQDEDEGEDEPLDETFAQEQACEAEEELQDQAALAEFFNMRFQPTMDTIDIDGNPSKLDEDDCTPLFEGSSMSKLIAILLLSNLQQKYNVSNSFMDSLYALLAKELLPKDNALPDSHRSAWKMMSSVGLDYQMIHACPNKCYLYKAIASATDATSRVENTRTCCPICGASRYRFDTQGTTCPVTVLHWFPLIPWLLLTFRCPSLADLMKWHHENRSDDGIMRTVGDSQAMQHVEATYDRLRDNPRVVHKNRATMDVYLEPLVEELKLLWDGVRAYDVAARCPRDDR